MARFLTLACVALLVLAASSLVGGEAAGDFVWLEGEAPARCTAKPDTAGRGHKEFLSGSAWLQISLDPANVEKDVPAEGLLLDYAFSLKKDAEYETWARLGYESVRSPFDWRLDGGNWASVTPQELTSDLMELDVWCEVAWLKLSQTALKAGDHKLELRLSKANDDKGKTARILFALDAICIFPGAFHPNGKFKPGEDWREAIEQEAAKTVFDVPEPKNPGERASVPLKGAWEICRHDEQLPGEVAVPMKDFPEQPFWRGIQVPGDKNTLRPDLVFAHRLWYRTRINVPQALAGKSVHILFPENNLNTTVYVNKVLCGFNKNPFARFDIDITKGLKPGVNEVWVGIRDAWYGYSTNPKDPLKLRRAFNRPLSVAARGFQDLAYPVWHHFQSGILLTPELVVTGPLYAADVFPLASVANKELTLEVTVRNPGAAEAKAELLCEAVNPATGEVEKKFAGKEVTVAAGAESVLKLAEKWENPKLWWPDAPQLYTLRSTLTLNGAVADIRNTTFGFREWTSAGKDFKLNGLVWHGWADCFNAKTPEDWIAFYRKTNQRMMRFWGTRWINNTAPHDALDFFDRNGVVVRRSGILDGEAIGYWAIENDPELKKESPIKMELMRNWRDQVVAQVKGERNHPSVLIWSIENEWLYINCINLYGKYMDTFEEETTKTSEAVRAIDPTRFTMTDGGGAAKNNSMPVQGDHYVFGDFPKYPDLAYDANPTGGGRGRWVWDQQRPRFIGEDYFANGINPFDYSYFGGEETFQGKAQARRAGGIIFRNLTEGYRWAGYGAWHFWMGQNEARDQYISNSPRAVFCRQWDWTFGGGQNVKRTLRIFNDTRFDDPISFTWALKLDGKQIAGDTKEHRVAPGASEEFEIAFALPAVEARTEGQLELALKVKDAEVFRDTKAVSVLNTDFKRTKPVALKPDDLLLCDPQGSVAKFLTDAGIAFTPVADLQNLPESGKVLILGKDAVSARDSASSKFQAYAAAGRGLIVLEQQTPLKYQALPADLTAATNEGRTGFAENLNHPALAGLAQKDFFTWGPNHVVYRNAYEKATRGATSLVQCHERLKNTALVEVPAGKGVMLLSQLVLAEKLPANAVAQQLLINLINYAAQYKVEYRPVALCQKDAGLLTREVDAIGLQYAKVAEPLDALADPNARIAVITASPENLKLLAGNLAKVEEFTNRGGWIFFHGLTPEGLADYNKIVKFDHMIRPFRMERVTFPAASNPLTAGLTTADIVMQSGKRINTWTSDVFLAADEFSYIIDYDDVAPFAQLPEPQYFKYDKAENDHDPYNIVNGFVSADSWKYIFSIPLSLGSPTDFEMVLPQKQEICELEWIGNALYHPVTKLELTFDGDKNNVVTLKTEPNNEPQVFPIEPPRACKTVNLKLAEWDKVAKTDVIGVDNIRLKAKRPPEFYQTVRPLLNIGAMMEYPRGAGGLLLCQVLFQQAESVPENVVKKRAILSTLLRNLKAPFAGGKTIIAGANLKYTPLDISKSANQYRGDNGWFGDKKFTFKDMPTGTQKFAGVPFQIHEFATSQVPTVVMLNGNGIPNKLAGEVKGITIACKADALFFLHTARLDARMNKNEIRDKKKYEMCRYVVNYSDGQTANIPVYAEIDIHDYKQKTPEAVAGAQIAWTQAYPESDLSAVAYFKQWNNPRPDVEIKSIDMLYGEHKRGVPALLAITGATAE
jgi:beta-galactosidase